MSHCVDEDGLNLFDVRRKATPRPNRDGRQPTPPSVARGSLSFGRPSPVPRLSFSFRTEGVVGPPRRDRGPDVSDVSGPTVSPRRPSQGRGRSGQPRVSCPHLVSPALTFRRGLQRDVRKTTHALRHAVGRGSPPTVEELQSLHDRSDT